MPPDLIAEQGPELTLALAGVELPLGPVETSQDVGGRLAIHLAPPNRSPPGLLATKLESARSDQEGRQGGNPASAEGELLVEGSRCQEGPQPIDQLNQAQGEQHRTNGQPMSLETTRRDDGSAAALRSERVFACHAHIIRVCTLLIPGRGAVQRLQ